MLSLHDNGSFKRERYPSVKPTLYTEYYRILGQALQGKGDVPVKAEDAAQVLRIIELANESSQTGKKMQW